MRCLISAVIYIVFEELGSEIFRKEYLGGSLVGKQTALTYKLNNLPRERPTVSKVLSAEDR